MSRGHQAHFSTEQPEAQAAPRVSSTHGDPERPENPGAPPRQGPQAPERLSRDGLTGPPRAGSSSLPPAEINDPHVTVARLTVRREFLFVAAGASERKRMLVVQGRPRPVPRPAAGAGFTATRKVGGSVVRNRARRRLREAVRIHLPRLGLAGVDYVFIARQDTADCPWGRLLDDMESALLSLRRRISAGDSQPPSRSAPRPPTKG